MRKTHTIVLIAALLTLPSMASAVDKCPTELADAKAMLGKATAAAQKNATAQPSRQLAGAKSQDVQAPRSQDVQAPKAQDLQAPRGQDVQAPKTKAKDTPDEIQIPRGQEVQAPRIAQARKLIGEAEAACKKGDMTQSAGKAKEAMGLLK